jgi:hypothetical protein
MIPAAHIDNTREGRYHRAFVDFSRRCDLALKRDQLLRLARHGAAARLAELRTEIASILRAFPGIGSGGGQGARTGRTRRRSTVRSERATAGATRRGRRSWNATQRRAAAARMKAYWAKRKAGDKK